ncbi:MAG: hypothetical protein Q4A33_02405 [Candidatus Saccharibacteria bacterium]|nr:hypothetical protein [Candidatus Saccharibacteria bacterium]
MDKQAYLDQLAASNRPEKAPKLSALLGSKIFKIASIAIVAFVVIILIGQILSSFKVDTKQELFDFKVRLDTVSDVIKKYQGSVKSSKLRSNSASFSTIVSSMQNSVAEYAEKVYPKTKITGSKDITDAKEELENDLHSAKINGLLDRVYARKLSYEISVIMAEESKLLKTVKDADFKQALQRSYESLSIIKDSIENLSL